MPTMKNDRYISAGVSFCMLTTCIFSFLKVNGFVHCTWWEVFTPIWLPLLLALFVLFIALLRWCIKIYSE